MNITECATQKQQIQTESATDSASSSLSIIKGMAGHDYIPAKPLHNSDSVSVHFNHFYCMEICDKLSRHLYMLTYIYLNMDEC